MVITHKKSTKLETAYYNIIWRLNNAGIKYETENHIIPQYNPDARDENGNPYPEPAPDTVGTGTAWIKIFHEDHKIVFVYFCCHLVECKTCTYDRFITVYNYTDDVKDTNLQGMLPALTLKYYSDREESDKDRTVFFDEFSLNDLGYEYISAKKPVTDATETTCETCNGKGTVESETTVPSGNPYIKPVTIKINTTCPDCNGTGKTVEETTENFARIYTFNVYGFYVKKSAEEHDIIDNRINDGVREGLPDDDPSNLGEGGLVKYAKRLYTSENSYDPEDAPVAELSKITTYNTELYLNNGKLLNSVNEIYELIEKTNVNNKNLPEDEKVDLSKYLFAIPVFREYLIRDEDNKPANDYELIDFRFYQTNYVDQYGKLIPIVAFCAFDTQRNSRTPYFSDGYNELGYSDRSSFPLYPEHIQYNPNKVAGMFPSYTHGDIYTQKGIKNFTKHCGEIETANGTVTAEQKVIVRPMISTFTDISQTDRVWNFICYKDKNLPIVPCDRDTLYISETTWPYKMDLYKDDHVKFNNILSQKTAAYVEPLDSKLLGPGEELLPKIQYNYNNYPEGVFTYYQTNYGTYIENYIFHKYGEDHLMDVYLDTEGTDEQIKLIPDTIESQKEYHGFMNILYEKKLRSIYTKMDTHNDFVVCPACNGMDDIDCAFCGNKRKLSIFDCNIKSIESDDDMHKLLEDNSLKRYVCPSINDIDHEHRASCYGRCRCCAGTKSVIRYYYLKAFEFKNLTEYDGKLPKEVPDLSDIEALDIIGKVLESKVKEKGSATEEAYLNYIVRKHYDVEEAPGEELDVAYSQLYNAAANNLVFYILNGNFIAYYFWNGYTHVKVDYGYNYIYSTKTYSKKEWEKIKDTEDGHKSTLLYRIISTEQEIDDMVGFYSINVPNVKIDYQDVSSIFEGATVQRIYFDKSWVYSNLLSDMTFKHFNMFTEKESLIVGNHQSTEDYVHIHDEEEDIVQSRCPTCSGTGEVDGAPCETCGGTGDYPDNVLKENLYYTRQLYCYTSLPYINTDNISFEVNDQQKPEFDGDEVDEINYEE